jgi:hypothetical protein
MHLQGGDLFLVCRVCGEFKVGVGCVVTDTVGSTGGKVNWPVAVRRDMFGTEAENCGVSFGEGVEFVRGTVVVKCLDIIKVLVLFPSFRRWVGYPPYKPFLILGI